MAIGHLGQTCDHEHDISRHKGHDLRQDKETLVTFAIQATFVFVKGFLTGKEQDEAFAINPYQGEEDDTTDENTQEIIEKA